MSWASTRIGTSPWPMKWTPPSLNWLVIKFFPSTIQSMLSLDKHVKHIVVQKKTTEEILSFSIFYYNYVTFTLLFISNINCLYFAADCKLNQKICVI